MLNGSQENRFDFDDAQSAAERGLQVVSARFLDSEPFNWNLFEGFDNMRVLTYSVSAPMIVRMLKQYSFKHFECVFGYEGGSDVSRTSSLFSTKYNAAWIQAAVE